MKQKINNLEIEEDLKSKLLKLLINSSYFESEFVPEIYSFDELNELEEYFSSEVEEEKNNDSCLCSTFNNFLKVIEKVNHFKINLLTGD